MSDPKPRNYGEVETTVENRSSAKDALQKSCYFKIDFGISEEATVYEAVQRFAAYNIGALAVTNADKKVIGIVSERDYVSKVKGKFGRIIYVDFSTAIQQLHTPVTQVSAEQRQAPSRGLLYRYDDTCTAATTAIFEPQPSPSAGAAECLRSSTEQLDRAAAVVQCRNYLYWYLVSHRSPRWSGSPVNLLLVVVS